MYSTDLIFLLLSAGSGALYLYYAIDRSHADPDRRGVVVFWRDIFVIFFLVFVFRGFFFDWFKIPSNSMQPTLRVGDYVLVEKNRYGFRMPVWHWRFSPGEPPERGDIVVFRKPGDEVYFIKRIIGIPGDKLSYLNGRFYIDNRQIPSQAEGRSHFYSGETYEGAGGFRRFGEVFREQLPETGGWYNVLMDEVKYAEVSQPPDDNCELLRLPSGRVLNCILPGGFYFVAGDNREHSNDSRYWGLLPESHLIGPAVRVLHNFSHEDRSGLSLAPSRDAYIPAPTQESEVQTQQDENAQTENTNAAEEQN